MIWGYIGFLADNMEPTAGWLDGPDDPGMSGLEEVLEKCKEKGVCVQQARGFQNLRGLDDTALVKWWIENCEPPAQTCSICEKDKGFSVNDILLGLLEKRWGDIAHVTAGSESCVAWIERGDSQSLERGASSAKWALSLENAKALVQAAQARAADGVIGISLGKKSFAVSVSPCEGGICLAFVG